MMVAPFLGLSLVVAVATGPLIESPSVRNAMTNQQKRAAIQPLVRGATECLARTVAAQPNVKTQEAGVNLGEMIVRSMPTCAAQVRAMIDAHDTYFGDGTGETFFMGPYLDVLPTAISRWLEQQSATPTP
jgi:hypothetical protein